MADIVLDLGTSVPGECAFDGTEFKNKITCTSVSFNSTQEVERGRNATRTIHTVNVEDMTVSRLFDSSSAPIWKLLIEGKTIPTAYVYVVKAAATADKSMVWFVKYTLTNVLVAGQNVSFGESEVTDELTLNFTKIKVEYKKQNADGSLTVSTVCEFDLQQGKASNS
jgi:type VI secretion system secreted protein Hcp